MFVEEGGDSYRLRWPTVGGVSVLLALPLVYQLVSVATPILVDELSPVFPEVFPDPFTTIVAVLLWVGLGVFVLAAVTTDLFVRTIEFESRDAFITHLRNETPTQRWYALNAIRTVLGGAVAVVSYEPFLTAFGELIRMVVLTDEFELALTVADGGWFVAFLVAFTLLTGGVDRLLNGGLRSYIERTHTEDFEGETDEDGSAEPEPDEGDLQNES